MENLIYLHPNDIGVHPVLKYFEENGAFSYTDRDLERLIASFKTIGPLQPILITPAGQNSEDSMKWWRVAGKLRIAAAKKVGCNLPCYIRIFESDEEVIRAARYENSVRRHWDIDRLHSEDELIDKLISRMSRYRLNNAKKLHPDWLKLLKSGLIRYRSDDSFITNLKELDYDMQEALAEMYNNAISIRVTKGTVSDHAPDPDAEKAIAEKIKKEIEKEIVSYSEKNKELMATVKRLQDELNNALKAQSDVADIDEIAERYEKRIVALRTEKHAKESEIMQLKNELCNTHQKFSEENDLVRKERFNHLSNDLNTLSDSTLTRIEQLGRAISAIFNADSVPVSKDAVLVLNDQLEKFIEKFTKQANGTRNLLLSQLKRYKDNQIENNLTFSDN